MLIDAYSEEMEKILDRFLSKAFAAFGDGELTPLNRKEWIKNWQKTIFENDI